MCNDSHNMPHSRALRRPQIVTIAITPYELHLLVETLEANAARAAVNSETITTAGDWFRSRRRTPGGRSMSGVVMRFAQRPQINWAPPPSPRRRGNWCGLCGLKQPRLFSVPDEVWAYYVEHDQRGQIICRRCWRWLTDIIDGSACELEHGRAVGLWSYEFRLRHGIPPDERSPWDGTTEAEAPP